MKVNGTGLDTLLKGKFSAKDIGPVTVCLDPGFPPYLLLEDEDGNKFIFGSREEGETQLVFDKINENMK